MKNDSPDQKKKKADITKSMNRDKERHYNMIKCSVQQKAIIYNHLVVLVQKLLSKN